MGWIVYGTAIRWGMKTRGPWEPEWIGLVRHDYYCGRLEFEELRSRISQTDAGYEFLVRTGAYGLSRAEPSRADVSRAEPSASPAQPSRAERRRAERRRAERRHGRPRTGERRTRRRRRPLQPGLGRHGTAR